MSSINRIFSSNERGAFRIKRILLAGFSTLGSKAISLLVTLVSVPLTFNYLDQREFGLLMTILSFISMLSFADLGLGYGLLNRIAEYDVNSNVLGLKKAISSAFGVLTLCSAFGLISLAISYKYIDWDIVLNMKSMSPHNDEISSVLVFLVLFLITLPFSLITKIQIGFQETHINQVWDAAGNLLSIIFLIIVVNSKLSVPYIILATYGTQSFFVILNFVFQFLFIRKNLLPSIKYIDMFHFSSIFKEGLIFFVLQLFAIGSNSSDSILIAKFMGVEKVAEYAIGYKMISILLLPIQAFVGPILPAVNDSIANNDLKWLNKIIKKTFKILLIITLPLAVSFIYLANPLAHLWINDSITLNINLLIGFALFFVYLVFNTFFTSIFLAKTFIKVTLIYYPIAAIITIILKLVLIQFSSIPILLILPIFIFTFFYFIPLYYNLKQRVNAK